MKHGIKPILLLAMLLTAFLVTTGVVCAKDVTTAKQLKSALKNPNVKTVVIKSDMSISCLYTTSNKTIIATGRVIECDENAIRNTADALNYNSVKNITIDGGTWKCNDRRSLFQFVHGQNITIKNADITCGVKGHAIELIACKDVSISNCKITGVGKAPKSLNEEQIQIDIATPKTAPSVKSRFGGKYTKGQTCKNVTISNCTVTGGRGICSNFAKSEKKYRNRFHKNITIKNCYLKGKTSEALALFNAVNVKVLNNKIKTTSKRTKTAYSIGCHVHIFGKLPKSLIGKRRTVTIKNNIVYGGRQAIQVYSSAKKSKFTKCYIYKNKAFCKKGKRKSLKIGGVKKVKKFKNKLFKW